MGVKIPPGTIGCSRLEAKSHSLKESLEPPRTRSPLGLGDASRVCRRPDSAHRFPSPLRRKFPDHTTYVHLHERVNTDRFALLLPNGQLDGEGNRFWNPTDRCCAGGKTGEDDVAYLTELIANARKVKDFGPMYFFGYSNGGFMSHHIACKGLPGLRAVASWPIRATSRTLAATVPPACPCCTSTVPQTT